MDPIQRRRAGVNAMLVSLVFFGVSAAASAGLAVSHHAVVNQIAANDQDCQNSMKLLGASNASVGGDDAKGSWSGVEGGQTTLASASAAAMACPGWKMTAFCMGQGCATPGASLTLHRAMAGGGS